MLKVKTKFFLSLALSLLSVASGIAFLWGWSGTGYQLWIRERPNTVRWEIQECQESALRLLVFYDIPPRDLRGMPESVFGFYWMYRPSFFIAQAPYWFFILIFTYGSVRCFQIYKKSRRSIKPHCCKQCGYDLRVHLAPNSPAGPNCPECGTPIPISAKPPHEK